MENFHFQVIEKDVGQYMRGGTVGKTRKTIIFIFLIYIYRVGLWIKLESFSWTELPRKGSSFSFCHASVPLRAIIGSYWEWEQITGGELDWIRIQCKANFHKIEEPWPNNIGIRNCIEFGSVKCILLNTRKKKCILYFGK